MKKTKRKVHCADALIWMENHHQNNYGSVITSLPDLEEVSMEENDYNAWFEHAAMSCMNITEENCPTIFYQTDRKFKGGLISKSEMLFIAARKASKRLLWHKIVMRRDIGKIDLMRPGFSHLLCFGDNALKSGKATPDILSGGGALYANGMALSAATTALQFALKHSSYVLDPFCGMGTVLVLAENLGFSKIVGVDIDEGQVEAAKRMKIGSTTLKPTGQKRKRLFGN